jgi:uncharacterized protein YndB with AHSA1/START domain
MGKDFHIDHTATVPASPEQVWDAIATGPGISSWFVGRTEIDGDTVRTAFGDNWIPAGHITASEKPARFAHGSDTAPDGRRIAYEFLIEGRDRSATVLRSVTSGFLPGDDWAGEYEAMSHGTDLFFATLTEYLHHFPGRTGHTDSTFGPPVTDWPAAWAQLHASLGLPGDPRPGDKTADGVVYHAGPHTLGIRTPTALHRHIRGLHGAMVTDHIHFA